jgi:hypothetical protein
MSGPLVIDKMWLLLKRANKIHVLLFISNYRHLQHGQPSHGGDRKTFEMMTST